MTNVLTLGGFRPGSNVAIIPTREQQWWKPCLTRAEDGIDTHVWFLSPTSSGSVFCPQCRPRAPRVVIGPADWIADIRHALELGELRRMRELLEAGPEPEPTPPPAPKFKPRDREDWLEYFKERAAIFEYLGGRDRAEAERLARELAGEPPRHGASGPLFAGAR